MSTYSEELRGLLTKDLSPSLRAQLESDLSAELAKESGVTESASNANVSDVDRLLPNAIQTLKSAHILYDAIKLRRAEEETLRRSFNPDYDWADDAFRKEDVKTYLRYEQEYLNAAANVAKLQGCRTFRVGESGESVWDTVFTTALEPIKAWDIIARELSHVEDNGVASFSDLIIHLVESATEENNISTVISELLNPVFRLAQSKAQLNKVKSDAYLRDLRKTPFDVFCGRIDRIVRRVMRALNMPQDATLVQVTKLPELISAVPTFKFDAEKLDVSAEKDKCGDTWDDSILETLEILIEGEIIIDVSTQTTKTMSLKDMKELHGKMCAKFAYKNDFFVNNPDEEIRSWTTSFDLFRRKRDELMTKINAGEAEARKRQSPRPVTRR